MSKIFEVDFRKGSLNETYQNSLMTITGSPKFVDTPKGVGFTTGTSQRLASTTISRFQAQSKLTIVAWAKLNAVSYSTFFDFTSSSSYIIQFGSNVTGGGRIICYLGNGAYERGSIAFTDFTNYHQFIMIFDGTATENANKLKLFIDGVQQTISFSTNINATQTHSQSATAYIGYSAVDGYGNLTNIRTQVFNHAFSTSEINDDYQDFLKSKPIKKSTTNYIKPKPTELKENGLLAAYNMKRVGNVINDISGNGYNLTTITKAISTDKGTRIVQGMLSGPATFLQPRSVSIRFKVLSSDSTGILVGGLRWKGTYNNAIFVNTNGVYVAHTGDSASTYGNANTILVGQWATLTVVFDGLSSFQFYINGSAISTTSGSVYYYLGNNISFGNRISGGHNIDCEIEDCRIYNRALSLSEIQKYHNQFVRPTLVETFENNGADNVAKGIQGWTIASGTFKINENTVLQTSGLKRGDKYLECATAGGIKMPSSIAYGTWEFDWYKGSTTNDLHLYLIWGTLTSMTFRVYIDEGIYMRFNGVGGFQTVSSYIANNTWYRTKITRSITGVTSCYIKGGAFGSNYVLVAVSAGANPVTQANPTSSNMMYFDIDAGDRIANIKIYDGVII